MNNLNPALDYGASSFDQRNHFSLTLSYAIPGRKGFGQLLEGWSVNSAILLQSGLPYNPTDSRDISKTGDKKSDRWDFFGNPSDFKGGKFPIPFFPGTNSATIPAYVRARSNRHGTMGAWWQFAGVRLFCQRQFGVNCAGDRHVWNSRPGYFPRRWLPRLGFFLVQELDAKERLTAQFRAEFFNILNETILANPGGGGLTGNGSLGCGCQTPDSAGQNPLLGTGGARAIQFGLKLIF